MAGITWWTNKRLVALAALAAKGLSAREIARKLSARFHRRLTPGGIRCVAERFDIPLLDRGGRPKTPKKEKTK